MVKALEDLAAVLNCVAHDYLDSTSFFEGGPEAGGALELPMSSTMGLRSSERNAQDWNAASTTPQTFSIGGYEIKPFAPADLQRLASPAYAGG